MVTVFSHHSKTSFTPPRTHVFRSLRYPLVPAHMSPAQYVSVSLATCVGLCRFGEAWAALRAENLLTYLLWYPPIPEVRAAAHGQPRT